MWGLTFADLATIALNVGWLVVLEGLLSADNALVLAVMVRHLPGPQQKRALRYGIWGAFLFRLIAVVLASYLLRFWQLKVAGGLYLIYLAVSHFVAGGHDEADPSARPKFGRGFWGTVISVELADIAFSIDSILAAVGMVETLPQKLQDNNVLSLGIIYLGGILGILMMRYVAGIFIRVLNRFQGLAAAAYLLVAWIGLKLTGAGLHDAFHPRPINGKRPLPAAWLNGVPQWAKEFPWEMGPILFWGGMAVIIALGLLYKPKKPAPPIPESLDDEVPSPAVKETSR